MTTYELKLEQFSGPTETLLELIEAKKLDITEISLATVTADFLKHIKALDRFDKLTTGGVHPKILADFIAVAAKLIIIKSRLLSPQMKLTTDEEKEIADLENRLKFYRQFRPAEKNIKELWQKRVAFARDYLADFPEGFYLTDRVEPSDLEKEIKRLSEELLNLTPALKEEKVKLIRLEEKVAELLARLSKAFETSFRGLTRGKERSETVVLFLALLHLLKESLVKVEQQNLFSDIKISSLTKDGSRRGK